MQFILQLFFHVALLILLLWVILAGPVVDQYDLETEK